MLVCTAETASGDLDWIEDDHVGDEDEFGAVSVGEIVFLHVGCTSRFPQDAMGSVIGMADGSGASTASFKYDSFGNVTSAVGASASIPSSIGTDFRYHGMQLDAVSGLYHVRARTYDARTGRFTSRDPVAGFRNEPESMNPYVFCYSNPHTWADPEGMWTLTDTMIAVTITGILAATAAYAFGPKLRGFRGYKEGWAAGIQAVGETWSVGLEQLERDPDQAALDLANSLDDVGVDDYAAGIGDTLTGVPFTDFNGTTWIRSHLNANGSVDRSSDAYDGGVLAGVAIQLMNAHPKLPGWMFGRAPRPGPVGNGLLNRNNLMRIGWGWSGRAATGNFVFRISIGSGANARHYTLLNYARNWIGGLN